MTVANALLISILQYPTSVTYTPERVTQVYKKITTDFLWDGKRPKIAHSTLVQTIENGGLKLLDLKIRVEVNLLQWVRRMTTETDMNAGKVLRYLLQTDTLKQYFLYRKPQTSLPAGKCQFYKEMMKACRKYRNFEPEDKSTICKEALWFNGKIGPSTSGIHWPTWQEKGIEMVGDICHESEDRLMSHIEITDKFNLRCTFLDALSIRASIPIHWRKALTKNWQPNPRAFFFFF